jgi:hypothetical protein
MSDTITTASTPKAPQEESMLWNLSCNILIPTILLTKGNAWYQWVIEKIASARTWDPILLQDWEERKTAVVLLIALLFPLGYGLRDLWQRKKCNLFSVIGLLNVALTGVVGLFAMDSFWIAVKEASVPLIFGLAILVSMRSQTPLVRTLFLNDKLLRHDMIREALQRNNNEHAFVKLEKEVTWILCGSFLLSAFLNFALARIIVTSPGGSEAFNAEIGKMTALSWPVIVVPSMIIMIFALWRLFHQLGRLTGLKLEEMMQDPKANAKSR